MRRLNASGNAVSFAWSAMPDSSPGSDIFYTVGRDITDELRSEELLRQSQKMEAVGRLTGGIAHDFNNLLQAVHGNLELIRRKPHGAQSVTRWANNGLLATDRGNKLTAQLLAFSRAQKLEMRPTPVAPLLHGMKGLLQQSLGPLITVNFDIGDDDLAFMVDPTQLEMALLNLAIDARDAMPDGGELSIRAAGSLVDSDPELEPGPYVEVRVTDTGTGMPPEVVDRAFEPFFTTEGTGKGTGLGLSQVRGMTRQAGGAVRIESRPSIGTSIVLSFRRVHAPVSLPVDAVRDDALPASARAVLVVDDDPDVRQVLADTLQSLGLDVTTAADGPQAIALLERTRPDLLLLDFAMPGMNGAELADIVRRRYPQLPIVFATGYSETAAVEAAVGNSVVILKKPFQIVDLEAVLQATISAA